MTGVAVGGDDCVVRFGEIELKKALADASVGASDKHSRWSHAVYQICNGRKS